MEGQIPSKDSVYEYFVDPKTKTWAHWEQELRGNWRYGANIPFHQIQVPTVDMLRYEFPLRTLITNNMYPLVVGPVGRGKTSVIYIV